jgi:hypothetical protein
MLKDRLERNLYEIFHCLKVAPVFVEAFPLGMNT